MDDNLSPLQRAVQRFGGECHPARQLVMLLDRVENVEKVLAVLIKEKPEDKLKMSVEDRMEKARAAKGKK